MRKPEYAGQFKRDIKLAQKRGKNMAKLKQLLELSSTVKYYLQAILTTR